MKFGAATFIKRFICQLQTGEPFSTRAVLFCGTRAAVDQALSRLVKKGIIRRLLPGIFMRNDPGVPSPPLAEIAKLKIESFGRKIFKASANAAIQIGIVAGAIDDTKYATDGHSTSFHYNGIRITVQGMAQRKLIHGDDNVGLVIRGLWYLGKSMVTEAVFNKAVSSLFRKDKERLRSSISLLPWWISDFLTQKRVAWQDRKVSEERLLYLVRAPRVPRLYLL